MHIDNPAGRLLAILEKVRSFKAETTARTAWMQALQVPDNDPQKLLQKFGSLMALAPQAIDELKEKYPRQYQNRAHAYFYEAVTKAFSRIDFNNAIGHFNNAIDVNAMNYLHALADLLEAKKSTNPLTDDQLVELQGKVHDLMDFIRSCEMSPELKYYLLGKLSRIMEAIDSYFITGAAPIVDAIESTFGHAAFNEEYRSNIRNPAWRTFVSGLAAIANTVTIAAGAPGMIEGTIMFLDNMTNP